MPMFLSARVPWDTPEEKKIRQLADARHAPADHAAKELFSVTRSTLYRAPEPEAAPPGVTACFLSRCSWDPFLAYLGDPK
ncbi:MULTISPECIES: hypothetical protein [unclassified Frankia]|uniref:hypothetical protein n=1 Tax=unclassified Frankia TaxID=2632575 RepID=UPI001EF3E439|nr:MULTISPECIES: hypothetical protein [unclassified Frankia]